MARKIILQGLLIITILLTSVANVGDARAWSNCGSTYTIQWGDTISQIAQRCGTTVSALYAANPWLGYYIYAGQVLVMPNSNNPPPQGGTGNTYTVKSGDTFAKIANRYGVSINSLWAANPQIKNINWIYVGQVIYIPASSSWSGSTSNDAPAHLSYGVAPIGAPTGQVKLINNANADVYISLQGTTKEGVQVINEYTVKGTVKATIPTGWYYYVAWVGGKQFGGQFQLYVDGNVEINIYSHKITVK